MADNRQNDYFSESKLDQLWHSVKSYRSSQHFMKVMQACARFRNLAPYNAMLVEMQRPGAKYVLSEKEWHEKFDRVINPNARPLIVLFPFGPVEFLFEISDTHPLKTNLFWNTDEEILGEIAAPYKTKHEVSDEMLSELISKLAINGIVFCDSFAAGAGLAGQIEYLHKKSFQVDIEIVKNKSLKWPADYLLSVNSNLQNGDCFATICHELGHLFCYHLTSPDGWKKWQIRDIPEEAKEFEAEAVSWLICERLAIGNPSDKYLNNYVSENEMIPSSVSIERILSAAKEVWNLCSPDSSVNYKDGLLYKNNEFFKDTVNGL